MSARLVVTEPGDPTHDAASEFSIAIADLAKDRPTLTVNAAATGNVTFGWFVFNV